MPNRLLLADEDPTTSRVLEVNLRGAGFEVTSVTTGAAAWVAIDQQLPQVILAATTLAALDGFELCTRVRAREGGRDVAFLLLGDEDSLALRIKSIEAGADDYLLKPVYVQDVVARVRALVQRRDRETFTSSARAAEAFAGQLSDLSVVDLLQVIADGRRSGIVHLRGAREAPATIYFRQGQVVDAEVGRLSGLDAISRLFSWTTGSFEVQWKPIRRPDAIRLSTPDLVLEGMKRLDERNRLAGGLPDLDGVFEVNYRVLAERLSEIPDEVNAVLRLFDGSRSLAHVVEDCQLPDPEAMAIAIRLRDEGIIHNVSSPGASDGALIVPPRPAGRRPSADDVTVVRRITSPGVGSGPVQQSFATATADRTAVTSSAETTVVPMPVGPGSFDEVDGVIPPENHAKTDPGLGRPLALSDLDPGSPSQDQPPPDAVPVARTAETGAPPGAEVTAPHVGEVPAAAWPDAHRATAEPEADPEPATPARAAADPGLAGLEADPSSLQTQRGLGPFPAELFEGEAPAGGLSLDAPADGHASETTRPIELDSAASSNGLASPASELDGPAASPAIPSPARDPESQGAQARAATTRQIDPVEDELSTKEALDELGVSGGRRGLPIMIALAVAAVLVAVILHKLRGSPATPVAPPATGERMAAPAPSQLPAEPAPATPPPPIEKPAAPNGSSTPVEKASGEGQPNAAPALPEAENAPAEPAPSANPDHDRPGAGQNPAPAPAAPALAASPAAPGPPADRPAAGSKVAAAAPAQAAPAVDFARQLATCRSQFLRDRIREAAATCAAALEANPGSADALTMMAHVELNRGHLARANDLAQKSIAIDANQADAYVIIGGVHQDSGRNAQAKVAYRRYLQLAPHGRYADEVRSIVGSL